MMPCQDKSNKQTRVWVGLALLVAVVTGCTDPTGPSCRQHTEGIAGVPEPTLQMLQFLLNDLQIRSVPGLPPVTDQVRLVASLNALGAALTAGNARVVRQQLPLADDAVAALHVVLEEDAAHVAELTAIDWVLAEFKRVLEPFVRVLPDRGLRSRCS